MDNSVTLYLMNCIVSKQSVLEIKDVFKRRMSTDKTTFQKKNFAL